MVCKVLRRELCRVGRESDAHETVAVVVSRDEGDRGAVAGGAIVRSGEEWAPASRSTGETPSAVAWWRSWRSSA